MEKLEVYGFINKKGKPIISGLERFNHIFKSNPGKRFIMDISVYEEGTNEHHIWYIMKMIVPAFIQGNKEEGNYITPKQAVEQIIDCCPAFCKDEITNHTLFDFEKWKPNSQMNKLELELAIEWLHIYCLENFSIVIGNYKSI